MTQASKKQKLNEFKLFLTSQKPGARAFSRSKAKPHFDDPFAMWQKVGIAKLEFNMEKAI